MASKLKSMARQKEEKLKHTTNSYTPEFKTEVRDMLSKMVLEISTSQSYVRESGLQP